MSTNIKQLINELCPNGVEWKTLGEVCESISSGKNKSRNPQGKYPVYGSTGIINYCDNYAYDKETLLIARVGSAGFVHLATGKYDVSDNTLILIPKENYNLHFAYYQLTNFNLNKLAKGGTQPIITASQIKQIRIPIPPLPVQEEIVKILDTFTELEAELELKLQAELEARKKQYEYYRNTLLTPEEHNGRWYLNGVEVEWKKLGEVCDFQNGFAFKSNLFKDSGLPIIRITNINGKNVDLNDLKYFEPSDYKEDLEKFKIDKGDILIAMSGATTGKIGYYDFDDIAYLNQRVGKFSPKKEILNNRFLYHFLNLNYQKIFSLSGGGAQPNLSSVQLMEKISIPIPPLSEQERIVAILDKFDALVNDISQGLPAEIEARKKQYEYYRNKLLTFKEKDS